MIKCDFGESLRIDRLQFDPAGRELLDFRTQCVQAQLGTGRGVAGVWSVVTTLDELSACSKSTCVRPFPTVPGTDAPPSSSSRRYGPTPTPRGDPGELPVNPR